MCTEITRTPNPGASPFETVTRYLSADHLRLGMILDDVARAVEAYRFAEARQGYRLFTVGLRHHIHMEEDILFPVFEARTGLVDGPITLMRAEHRAIEEAAAKMRNGLEASDADAFAAALRFFHGLLRVHESKEEHILYPITHSLLTT